MKNIRTIAKFSILIASATIVAMPLLAAAQFEIPEGTASGLPNQTSITDILIVIINILLAIAGLVAVIFLIVGGFRYITAGGNEEASDSAKKTIVNAIIGIVIIILSFVIVRVISNALTGGAV